MIKNLLLAVVVFLGGCILYIEDDTYESRDYSNDPYGLVWMESPYIYCTYDAYWDLSEWQIEIYADSHGGTHAIEYVGLYINNHDYQEMEYWSNGVWVRYLVSNYYDCDRSLHFDFIAADYEGYETSYTYYW